MSLFDALLLDGVRLNFWVAARTDGIAGSGSQSDPFNASSGQFDAVMIKILAMPEAQGAPLTVYLGPGIFDAGGQSRKFEQNQTLEDDNALPGICVPVAAIFQDL